ncbi:MAG: Efflux ABC transporter for glutathione/L-cysteine, essential for assembly of bd-type respiratory oxidases _ CydD subunit [uncultured Friedmanniella sp.]|uniref:Efflux ABC transporter for glutathione/L-cysteine, essential for assembly of bd-type respiratory oxidases > CydD subunit n=1 Tax=uncultured Friedmanniella sp. TaxID=335381 RepID=A0A6J4KDF8_9ACTN|nr:MAG: Efflux ABC transporter for glutathione/L-cysteine, essential for assembly of bd-type respiratory oxidases > CydD subunit [uncultured Friedmanniella sp.]
MARSPGRPPGWTRRVLALPGSRGLLPVCVGLALVVAAAVVVQWTLLARVVASVVQDGTAPGALAPLLAGVLGAWLVRSAALAARDRWAARASSRVRAGARRALAEELLRLGPDAVAGERAGELVGTATEGVGRLDAVVARFLPGAVSALVVPAGVLAAVLVLDLPSGLLLLATGPVLVVFLWLVGTHAGRAAERQWESLGQLGALLVDTLRVLPVLVAFRRARDSVRWLAGLSDAYRVATLKVLRTAFLSGFVLEFGAALCTALVAVTVGIRLFEGRLELERALLVLLLAPEFFAPLRALGGDHHARLEGRPAAERLLALLDLPEPPRGTRRPPAGVPHVRLAAVTVRAQGGVVLDAVDLDLPPGSRTALVGPSGAGKTTAVRLLLGLVTPETGAVLVDGVPLAELDPDAWRARLAHVPERPWLLPGSVADNVRLGRPGADDDAVEVALAAAGLLDVVRRLPQGVDTVLGEDGARFSGGERLRLALARAFIADAALVVLDEPTSQLDAGSEAAVLAALDRLARGRTVLTVTHRAAPLLVHDRVVRLEGGRVVDDEPAVAGAGGRG